MQRQLVALALLALLTPAAAAQGVKHDSGVWLGVAGQGHFEPQDEDARWRWWVDGSLRFLDDSDGLEQAFLRPALGYDVGKASTVWLGYGWFHNDPAVGEDYEEHRIWEQYTWGTPLGDNQFLLRSRLEQRFLDTGGEVAWRFRQFFRITRPFTHESRFGLRLWDELFFDLNDTDWGATAGFSQNRLFAGLGWTFDAAKHATLEFGYLNQFIYRPERTDAMNNILSVQLLLSW